MFRDPSERSDSFYKFWFSFPSLIFLPAVLDFYCFLPSEKSPLVGSPTTPYFTTPNPTPTPSVRSLYKLSFPTSLPEKITLSF